jgi:hypothetical protein
MSSVKTKAKTKTKKKAKQTAASVRDNTASKLYNFTRKFVLVKVDELADDVKYSPDVWLLGNDLEYAKKKFIEMTKTGQVCVSDCDYAICVLDIASLVNQPEIITFTDSVNCF